MNLPSRLILGCLLGVLWLPLSALAQTAAEIWQDVPEATLAPAAAARGGAAAAIKQRTVTPLRSRTLRVNGETLRRALGMAPREFTAAARAAVPAEFFLPLPDGTFARCAIEDSPVFDPVFEARHPELKTYLARGLDDPSLSARLDLTPQGFHAIIFSTSGTSYVDPYWRDDPDNYIAYRRSDYRNPAKPFACLLPDEGVAGILPEAAHLAARPTGAMLRTYRLAVACTGEYAAAAGGGTVNGTLAAIVTTVNRVSGLYERDLAIRLTLIGNEDLLIFTNAATDGYSNTSPNSLLSENQAKCDAVIGNANYDIGHVFTTGGGGLAGLAVVGKTGSKAKGETGLPNPVGDPYDIDFVAHEMGHQFGGHHPFNGTSGSCSNSNRTASTAYEPGSGITIMAYAGICSPQDLAAHSDDYFHTVNYDEIDTYTSGSSAGNVGVPTPTGNTPPVIEALNSYTIPSQTPFALTASTSDAENDVLTYCWEEFDLGPAQNPTIAPRDNGVSPIFRSFAPTTNPTRLFPSLTYILNNANVPPATVGGFATAEFLPTTSRPMNFRVTVRDNHAGGGGSNYASTTVTSTTGAGPFAVTSFENAASIAAGSTQNVTWAVANTTALPVNCANVKISLSTDGGITFPFVLAAITPNDGSENVLIPDTANIATTQGRIKVEAVDNIFFDISGADLTITSTTNSAPVVAMTDSVTVMRGTPTPVVAAVATVTDPDMPLLATISDAPDDAIITASVTGVTVMVSARADCSLTTTLTSRTYPVTLTVTDSLGASTARVVNLVVQPNPAPTLGTYTDQTVTEGGTVMSTPTALAADANNNLSATPYTVSPSTFPGGGTITVDQLTGVVTASPGVGAEAKVYPVRVTVQDSCGAAVVQGFNLTVLLDHPNNPPTLDSISSPVTVNEDASQTVNLTGISAGTGETQTLMITALSNNPAVVPNPTVNYTSLNATGSLTVTPVHDASGGATITVTVKDNAGTDNGGVDTITRTFDVTVNAVNDLPTLNFISNPPNILANSGEQTVNLSGIGAGGGEVQTLTVTATSDKPELIPNPTVDYTSPNSTATLTYTPQPDQSGTAIITVTVKDDGGGGDTITRSFTVKVLSPNDLLGIYNGLAQAASPAAVEKGGLLKLTTTKKGGVSGKLKLGASNFGFRGVLNDSGDVLFGKVPGTPTLVLKRKDGTMLNLTLHLGLAGTADQFTGAVTLNSAPYASLVAKRAFYSSKVNPFPAAKIVPYTAIFDRPVASLPFAGYPHGDGFGIVKVTKTGSVTLAGRLPDGTKFTYANLLSNGDFLPVWVPFFTGTGSLSGNVHFIYFSSRDFESFDMLWFRPPKEKGPFPAGWPAGITTDLRGSTYLVTKANPACLPTLSANDTNGNVEVTLSNGKLAANLRKALGVDPAKNKALPIPAADPDKFKFTIGGKTGLLSGSFLHPVTQKKVNLQGAIFQKLNTGSGYFLSTDDAKDTQSGSFTITVDADPLSP